MRVGVVGAGGKMGQATCGALIADPVLDLVGAVDVHAVGTDLGSLVPAGAGLAISGDLDALAEAGAEVIVDFTRVEAARSTLSWCAATGIHAVVGTTGFTNEDLAKLSEEFSHGTNCIVAANFAIGAVLMMRFAELAAPWFDGAEIVELHHDGKLDAPSGTSMRTAERMAAALAEAGHPDYPADRSATVVAEGARGAEGPGGVRLHSVRLAGLVAHQEILLGGAGQALSIRHDSFSRSSFMDGVLLAAKEVANRPGLTLGLEPLLGL